jgi:hypothetical protein
VSAALATAPTPAPAAHALPSFFAVFAAGSTIVTTVLAEGMALAAGLPEPLPSLVIPLGGHGYKVAGATLQIVAPPNAAPAAGPVKIGRPNLWEVLAIGAGLLNALATAIPALAVGQSTPPLPPFTFSVGGVHLQLAGETVTELS